MWRRRWCWIVEDDPQEFCRVCQAPLVRRDDWGEVDAKDEKLTIATTRIHRLTVAGLTLEMIGADFIRRRIAPLHNKGRPAWLFANAADIMRLHPGLDHNFTTLARAHFCQRLFPLDVDRDGKANRFGKVVKAGKVVKGPAKQ